MTPAAALPLGLRLTAPGVPDMSHEFVNFADCSVNLAHVTHAAWDGAGTVTLSFVSGTAETFTGDDADAVAKKLGRHDARHLDAKEAKAEEKELKAKADAEAEASEAASKAQAEAMPANAPARGHHTSHAHGKK